MKCRITIKVTVTWEGDDNPAERPSSVDITLLRDGEDYESAAVDTESDGVYTFACLPVWKSSGHKYTYEVDLSEIPEGYTKTINGFNIILTSV